MPRDYDDDDIGHDIAREPVPNYLTQAILVTVCCCVPLGIVSIVFASQANSLAQQGRTLEAREKAAQAKQYMIIGAIGGFLLGLLWLVAQVFIGMNNPAIR